MLLRSSLAVALIALATGAATAAAEHVGIAADVSAKVSEVRDRSVTIEVSWGAACPGAQQASYSGSLELVDQASGERIYLGGVSRASGTARQTVDRLDHDRDLIPRLKLSCWEDASFHGSETEAVGPAVAVAARGRSGAGDPGGEDDGPGSGHGDDPAGGSAPPPPPALPAGACAAELRGTASDDRLAGTSGHDRVLGLAGADRIRGRGGHDCLFGAAGRDRLSGGRGQDALDGGRGNDVLSAADGSRDLVRCGPGRDRAVVDRHDRLRGCERVRRRGG